jgi:hypothetical protein
MWFYNAIESMATVIQMNIIIITDCYNFKTSINVIINVFIILILIILILYLLKKFNENKTY